VRFLTGGAAGARFAITANTEDTLTVAGRSLDAFDIAVAIGGDAVELVPVDTLEMLFGQGILQSGTGAASADRVTLFASGAASGSYYLDSETSTWLETQDPFAPAGDTRLPAEGVIAITRRGPSVNMVIAGRVPSTAVNLAVANSGTTFTSSGLPVDLTLGDLALQNRVAGWVSQTNADLADVVGVAAGAGWVYYFHNGSFWQRVLGASSNRDDVVVMAGKPIRIHRRGSAPGTTDLIIPLP
jgi:uncharacterized protein (TIGR02597 family)